MSNIKVGGKVFRDIEKMSLEQLQNLRVTIIERQRKIADEGIKIQRGKVGPAQASRVALLDVEFKGLEKSISRIDAIAKAMIKKETTTKLMATPMSEELATTLEKAVTPPA